MKKIFIFLCFAFSVHAQNALETVQKLNGLLVNPEIDALKQILHDELTYGHSNGVLIEDKDMVVNGLVSGTTDYVSYEVKNLRSKTQRNTAWVRHEAIATVKTATGTNTVNMTVLLVLVKNKGKWQVLARQTARILPT